MTEKKSKLLLANDEDLNADPSTAEVKQLLKRGPRMQAMLEHALAGRVVDAHGPSVLKVSLDEFLRMKADPEFQTLNVYMQNLLFYANGQPRPHPVRPLLQNELGMWRGKVVVLNQNLDGMKIAPQVAVTEQLERPAGNSPKLGGE